MKSIFKLLTAALMVLVLGLAAPQAQAKDAAKSKAKADADSVTHDQAAIMIANLLGLYTGEASSIDAFEAMQALAGADILPSQEGWERGEVMTIAQFARVMVGALNLNQKVKNPSDSKEYIAVLKNEGIGVEDISGGLDELQVPFNFFIKGMFGGISSSDPLKNRAIIGEPDESGLGTEISSTLLDSGLSLSREQFASAITVLELSAPLARRKKTTAN